MSTNLLKEIEREKDIFKKHLLFPAWLSKELKQKNIFTPIIVGGTALEIYTGGFYLTGDIDIQYLKNRATEEKVKEKLEEIEMQIKIDFDQLSQYRIRKEFDRRKKGLEVRYKRTKPRDLEKWENLKNFILSQLPESEEILSGKYFREILKDYID